MADVDVPFQSPLDSEVSLKRHVKRTGTTRERTGCVTCRRRRKKCVENTYPICGLCRRLNLECIREKPRQLPGGKYGSDRKSEESQTSAGDEVQIVRQESPRIPGAVELAAYNNPSGVSDTRYLMKYYTQILSALCSTNHENNSFLSVFLPMAVESPSLLKCLMAWSSSHLSCFQSSYQIPAIEQRSVALRSVANSLAVSGDDPVSRETNLASCLILCSTEVALGDTSQWQNHLRGAKHIILAGQRQDGSGRMISGTSALMKTMDGEWLLRNFAYHDILGSVTTGEEPLIKGSYWVKEDSDLVDAYIGFGGPILALISEISCVQIPQVEDLSPFSQAEAIEGFENLEFSENTQNPPAPALSIWAALVSLECRLQSWLCPSTGQIALSAMAEAYRSAALLYLYRKMRELIRILSSTPALKGFTDTELKSGNLPHMYSLATIAKRIESQIASILAYLDEIPQSSLPECGILFPLFLAGGDSHSPTQMEAIQARLKVLLQHRGFGNIGQALNVLEELWRLRSCGILGKDGAPVDWIDVTRGTKLLLS